jgi:hypothetical protein
MQVLAFGCGIIAASTTPSLDFAPHESGRDLSRSGILSRVLFSMTTTLHIPSKHQFVEEALETLIMHHPDSALVIGRWLLINEYSENNNDETSLILHQLKGRFPFLCIIQKTAHDQGQANSLNIILRELRSSSFSYWLHVEESWRTVRPFLRQSLDFMDGHPYLDQLQLYRAAYYTSHTHTRITEDIEVIALDSNIDLSDIDPHDWRSYSHKWPSYSLRPSLTRVDLIKANPTLTFNADPDWFPVVFEFDFALKWQHSGGSMCAVVHDAIIRQEGHKSTYVLL